MPVQPGIGSAKLNGLSSPWPAWAPQTDVLVVRSMGAIRKRCSSCGLLCWRDGSRFDRTAPLNRSARGHRQREQHGLPGRRAGTRGSERDHGRDGRLARQPSDDHGLRAAQRPRPSPNPTGVDLASVDALLPPAYRPVGALANAGQKRRDRGPRRIRQIRSLSHGRPVWWADVGVAGEAYARARRERGSLAWRAGTARWYVARAFARRPRMRPTSPAQRASGVSAGVRASPSTPRT
jgi:hypothetical protein